MQEEVETLQYSDEDVTLDSPVFDPPSWEQIPSSERTGWNESIASNETSSPMESTTSMEPTTSNEAARPEPYSGNVVISGRSDRIGLMYSQHLPQEDVVYSVTKEPHHKPTRVAFIGNVRKPLDAMEFQDYLGILVRRTNPRHNIVRVWMNRSRTHALVLTRDVETARTLRKELNGSKYPDSSEREYLARVASHLSGAEFAATDMESLKQYELFVDYLEFWQMSQFIFEEDYGPKNAKWRVDYRRQGEHGEIAAEHTLLEGRFRPVHGSRRFSPLWSSYVPDRSEATERRARMRRNLDARVISKR